MGRAVQPVALKHYLQFTDDHYDRAINPSAEAVQNPVQQADESPRDASQPKPAICEISAESEGLRECTNVPIPPRGVEPLFPD